MAETASESLLHRIARRSFLTLWSYPNVFRDQGLAERKEGKEVVDLLVVFQDDIILFSDKACAFPDSGNLDLDWARWYRRAIRKSAEQLWGAERWIRKHPDRLYISRDCDTPLPIDLPAPDAVRFHRIIIANDPTGVRGDGIGGSGTLIIRPDIEGDNHCLPRSHGGLPFAVGQVDPSRGFVHVLDEVSMQLVLSELDTVSDFVWYLQRKERFVQSGRLGGAAGEEDLLALYLGRLDPSGEHDFYIPEATRPIWVEQGTWKNYEESDQRQAKINADAISYIWDEIIERFTYHTLTGTHEFSTSSGPRESEALYRLLAREPRVRRRMLCEAIVEFRKKVQGENQPLGFRVLFGGHVSEPVYVIAFVDTQDGWTREQYRERRKQILAAYCKVTRLRLTQARWIVGLATEGPRTPGYSEDLVLFDGQMWTAEDQEGALRIQAATGWQRNPAFLASGTDEYPVGPARDYKLDRSGPCPCKSGQRFDECCGRQM